ncbi:segregation/condensation protein A [Metamycoplasma orale]|uniref:Segregation and condensation protein A n=1 Tax=Metamycoplasma orale TaxID=2121 RepID=A0A448ZXL3_METOS|nr:segregation/condensation protein A [Metamycoplasma orale]VEU55996.1 segregation and condensation protein A [Metamycoplasma orale]
MQEQSDKPVVREISLEELEKTVEAIMKPKLDADTSDRISFKLDNFDGPLDLLLALVKEKNIDIFDVDLIELTNQYLEIIKNLKPNDFDMASEYLVMAATLIHLKARMILQDPEVEEEVRKEKKRLLEQIAEHQKFKEIGITLREKEYDRQNLYEKEPEDLSDFIRETDDSVLDGHANSSRLIAVLRKMFERTYAEIIRNVTITTVAVSPEEMKKRIIKLFSERDEVSFEEIFSVPSAGHFVITLLAVLDLARQQIIKMEQDEIDGLIKFSRGSEYGK